MNFNDAFGNINEDLENMARELNNKNKGVYKNVRKNNYNKDKETLRGIDAFENEPGFQFSPSQIRDNGDFNSGLPSHLDNNSFDNNSFDNKSCDNNSFDNNSFNNNSFDNNSQYNSISDSFSLNGKNSEHFVSMSMSDADYSDSDVVSEYSYLPKQKKKNLRMKTKHLQKYAENDEQLILEHIKDCDECKQHLLNMLKNDNHFVQKQNEIIKKKEDVNNVLNESSLFGNINYKEMKEVIILIIIGIIIIFVLDIFLRR